MKWIQIQKDDNVAVALSELAVGEELQLEDKSIKTTQVIPKGHKVATDSIAQGDMIIKYGMPIGHAIANIGVGEHVHTHNTKTNLSDVVDYKYEQELTDNPFENENRTFMGYKRENGDVGIRNEIWVIPTVGCVNGTGQTIVNNFKKTLQKEEVDYIGVWGHNYGCSQLGDDHENTKKILSNMSRHPNAGGVLVIGLGCENNQIDEFKKLLGDVNSDRVKFMVAQEVEDEIEEGIKLLGQIYETARNDRREEVPLSKLKVGLKCGGSDGLSGITANPLLGVFSDYLVAQGGTTVLTEVPEMFGAETLLMKRSLNEDIFNKTVELVNDFKEYFINNNQPVYENPSPGNKAGGITSLEDKSLGCTQKSGTSTIMDVLKYGDRLTVPGLNLLSAPGNDLVASSALAAAGCQMVLFTTGRGTPFGSFVPTMKISTNTDLAERKPNWIDFNAGVLVEGSEMVEVAREYIDYIIQVASGELVNNEKMDFRELAIFKTGITL
ncbi:MAG TPA: altronate dehydratase [Epulopiscium sp.]|nr:altronate dehydratase [Candidatus Epulonipiscium sp.]